MQKSDIHRINVERLGKWATLLDENHSTAVVLVAVGHDHNFGVCQVITTEDTDDNKLALFMQHACRMVDAGQSVKVE